MKEIDPTAWRDDARARVKTILRGMLDREEVSDDGLWSGRIRVDEESAVVYGLLDQVMLALIDASPVLLGIYPRGEALHYLKRDFGTVAKTMMRRSGYDLFPSEEASSFSRQTNRWRFVRLPSDADLPDRLRVIADYYRRRSTHHEAMSESRALLAKRDSEQAVLWASEAQRRSGLPEVVNG